MVEWQRRSVSARAGAFARKALAVVTLIAIMAMAAPWLILPDRSRARRRLSIAAWRLLLGGFGVRVSTFGQPVPEAGIYAANHVSWLDIAVLGRHLDAGFVAKAQVARWPVIGLLASRYGCAFVDRERRGSVAGQASTLRARIDGCRPVILFPEATTGPGHGVLPFRSSLFAAVGEGVGAMVQPVAIVYRRLDGMALSPAEMRRVAWLDDDALLPHALAIAAAGGVAAEIHFEAPVAAGCRKAVARHCQQVIAARLAGAAQPCATANRAA
ncbi:MAG: hypothetical protein RIQ46_1067 [Pseudomonadota bacterium]|jgi:1-acyl-sn-glycerol-3-phosphate acyltransferase